MKLSQIGSEDEPHKREEKDTLQIHTGVICLIEKEIESQIDTET